ncbi:MAG: hypothetical protein GXY83_44130 [Rhodopirellula sp.]|nr:hypothetical protein [Rhodopirellula sp.]
MLVWKYLPWFVGLLLFQHRYRAEDGIWSPVGKVFSSRGTYASWNNSPCRNAYFHDVLFDSNRIR